LRSLANNDSLIDASSGGHCVDDVAEAVLASGAQIVSVTMNTAPYYDLGVQLARKVKNKTEDVIFVAGGHHATFL
jgi:anaerobic magnesium-protoporphyrin IX monomethyl ester cyclase